MAKKFFDSRNSAAEEATAKERSLPITRNDLPGYYFSEAHRPITGIELGVAGGGFSAHLLSTDIFAELYGVDMYSDSRHGTDEYIQVLSELAFDSRYRLIRAKFSDALEVFPDKYFDFIYIDGYAHTGEEGGETIYDWAKKVKPGGVIAGHDYHDDWPLVKKSVRLFAAAQSSPVSVTQLSKTQYGNDQYPSWVVRLEQGALNTVPPEWLVAEGKAASAPTRSEESVKKVIISLTPPVIVSIFRYLRRRLLG